MMNKKKLTFFATAAMVLLSACSNTDDLANEGIAKDTQASEPVAFDVYTRSTQQTRAGYTGDIDLTAFRVTGFGVYAYVTPGQTWPTSGANTYEPDFMANQHVTYNGAAGSWVYSPVKYWPNLADVTGQAVDDLGSGTALNAGDGIDRVSFFAYAPYVASVPYASAATAISAIEGGTATGSGILYLPSNEDQGDPKVVYSVATDPQNAVDLMYGVAAQAYSGTNQFTGMDDQNVAAGMPFLNMTKMTTTDKMRYNFRHALTKLSVTVDGYFDEERTGSTPGTNDVDPNTRIVIESVTIGSDKLATYGTLNLRNTVANTPNWEATAISGSYALPIANNLRLVPGNEETVAYFNQQPLGVTKTAQPLFGYAADGTTPASMMFVPCTGTTGDLTVTITYYVITRDAQLEYGNNATKNVISNTIPASALGENAFKAGYATALQLHIGMTTVKFNAIVTAWENGMIVDTDLPQNVVTP